MTVQRPKFFVIYSWTDQSARIVKTKPTKLSPREMALQLDFEVNIPEPNIPHVALTINVPEAQVTEWVATNVEVEIDSERETQIG